MVNDGAEIQEDALSSEEVGALPAEVEGLKELAEGLHATTDEHGRFSRVTLSSDRARLMSKLSRERRNSRGAEELAETLLAALEGGHDEQQAAERVLMAALAKVIDKGGAPSVAAIRDAAQALSIAWSHVRAPKDGEKCPRCGQVVGAQAPVILITGDAAKVAAAALRDIEAMESAGGSIGGP